MYHMRFNTRLKPYKLGRHFDNLPPGPTPASDASMLKCVVVPDPYSYSSPAPN